MGKKQWWIIIGKRVVLWLFNTVQYSVNVIIQNKNGKNVLVSSAPADLLHQRDLCSFGKDNTFLSSQGCFFHTPPIALAVSVSSWLAPLCHPPSMQPAPTACSSLLLCQFHGHADFTVQQCGQWPHHIKFTSFSWFINFFCPEDHRPHFLSWKMDATCITR